MYNHKYIKQIFVLFAFSVIYVVIYSFNGNITLFSSPKGKKCVIASHFTGGHNKTPEMDKSPQRILLIGDSMAYSLGFRLYDYCIENKHLLKVVSWVSASTKWYATTDTIDYYVRNFKPTFIIFVIGSNELFISDIIRDRKIFTDTIAVKFCGIKSIWIGPPNWKADTGINDLLLSAVGYKRFYLSKNLKFERKPGDVAHLTRPSANMWMDSIANWIVNRSKYPICLKYPSCYYSLKPDLDVIKPLVN